VTDVSYDLGDYSRPIRTTSATAQVWFDRGIVWAFGFNHEEAVACFEEALRHDPHRAAAHWGIAYAVGPNYNQGWDAFDAVDLLASLDRARPELVLAREALAREVSIGETPPPHEAVDRAGRARRVRAPGCAPRRQ